MLPVNEMLLDMLPDNSLHGNSFKDKAPPAPLDDSLATAIIGDDYAQVQKLLDEGHVLDSKFTPLSLAAKHGARMVARQLLADKVEVNLPRRHPPVWQAAANGHDKILKDFIAAGADIGPDDTGFSPLLMAARSNEYRCVKEIVRGSKTDEPLTVIAPPGGSTEGKSALEISRNLIAMRCTALLSVALRKAGHQSHSLYASEELKATVSRECLICSLPFAWSQSPLETLGMVARLVYRCEIQTHPKAYLDFESISTLKKASTMVQRMACVLLEATFTPSELAALLLEENQSGVMCARDDVLTDLITAHANTLLSAPLMQKMLDSHWGFPMPAAVALFASRYRLGENEPRDGSSDDGRHHETSSERLTSVGASVGTSTEEPGSAGRLRRLQLYHLTEFICALCMNALCLVLAALCPPFEAVVQRYSQGLCAASYQGVHQRNQASLEPRWEKSAHSEAEPPALPQPWPWP